MNQQFDRFKTTLSTLLIQLGEKLLPVATALFKFLADVALPAVKNLAQWLGDKLGGAAAGIAQGWKDLTSKGGLLYGLMQQLPTILAAVHHYFDLLGQVWRTQIQPTLIQILPTLKVLGIILGVVILGVLASVVIMFLAVAGVITGVIFVFLKLVQGIQFVVTHFGDFLGAIGNFVGGVIGWFGNLQKGVEKKAHDLAENAVKKFMELQGNLMQWGRDTAKKVIDTLTGLPGRFLQLGKDIMHALANGIGNAAGAVGNALKNVPGIGGMLGGLSKIIPKFAAQGGVFGDGEWGVVGERGPESIQMRGGRAIITPLTGGGIAASPAGSFMAGGGAGGNGQPLVIQVNIDGRKAAQAIVPHMPGVIRTATGRRNI
jgi:phage-related protein